MSKPANHTKGEVTERQRELLTRIVDGKADKEIAREMGLGLNGVESAVRRMLKARGFVNRVQLAVWAVRAGEVQ